MLASMVDSMSFVATPPPKAKVSAPAPPTAMVLIFESSVPTTRTRPAGVAMIESATRATTSDTMSFKLTAAPTAALPAPAKPPAKDPITSAESD